MLRLFITLFIFSAFATHKLNAQTLKGKVYDSKSVVKDIKVLNITQNRLTVTDKDGNFNINATINDTIAFKSIFYHPKEVVLTQIHFNDTNVFEVKKITNALDEVEITAEPEQPVFNEETYNSDLNNLIKEDIKRNPHLYAPAGAQNGVDFIYLIGQVAKLFKRKKSKLVEYESLTYFQIDSLFNKSTFFNKGLVTNVLKIPKDKTKLFFDFCSAKGVSSEWLKQEHKMILLEALVVNSKLFLTLLEEYDRTGAVKD
ncbi:hypothetical protein [uncultured Winogradskyella sp.]|uniref:hypothetical protein n=1 Tax=uncultured Winogradskyella sp. TaxID=395353 RepID=UPI00261F595D|nr:hypothetical protein [uncultured Winogradskyella sp.]